MLILYELPRNPPPKNTPQSKEERNNLFSASKQSNIQNLDELQEYLKKNLLLTITANSTLIGETRERCVLSEVNYPMGVNYQSSKFSLFWVNCCDIPKSNFDNTKFANSLFKWVNLSNSSFNNAHLQNVYFEEVAFDYVNMSSARFANVRIVLDFPAKLANQSEEEYQQRCAAYEKGVRWSISTISDRSICEDLKKQLMEWLQKAAN